ncbi:hypothetical protein AO385_0827 [Moraxella catarrhalis]|uniref:Uncharacterized protein n=1 Tax=Moraxella catarrhalis TaxID=480 RepID=A0A198UPU3_MORCA|nr:hypothetical protein AO384_0101 [Moraxella catarrhalis]OAU98594.1 hypothetical protein AO383_0522 [Moraxella catarrhalis]OAV02846.1 hypothetical protein AO385_0827 [Moraxella catarrhalis]
MSKDKFNSDEWENVSYFYEIHLDGTEARHAEDLNQTIWEFVDNSQKEERFRQGFNELLERLELFWNGIRENI